MSIYDNAGVVLIPSGYKAASTDNLYSVLPANGNGDFNATRGSTATRVNKDGLIESVATNVPRLDYPLIDGVVQDCPALLLEPQIGNFGRYSEQLSSWVKNRATSADNQTISPDGSQNAGKATVTTASGSHAIYINQFSSVTSGVDYVLTLFVKKATTKYVRLEEGYSNYGVIFNFDTEEITTKGNASFSDIGVEKYPNGWYRLSVHFIVGSTSTSQPALYILRDSDANQSYTGTDESVFLWGLQMEAGTYHTSYIKNASTGTTTRSADVCNGSGTSAEFDSQSGALFAEFKTVPSGGNFLISVADGTSNTGAVFVGADANEKIYSYYNSANHTSDIDSFKHFNKIVNTWDSSGVKIYINGFSRTVSGSQSLSSSDYDNLRFSRANGSLPFYGDVKQVMTFKTKLTDSELETLTSWDSFNAMATGQLYTIE